MVQNLLKEIKNWAHKNNDLDSLLLVGSYASNKARQDSDIDLVLIFNDLNKYVNNLDWINEFGEIVKYETEYWGRVTSVRAWYKNGIEVEFGITSTEWSEIPVDNGTFRVVSNGSKILVDKSKKLRQLLLEVKKERK
ncbi:MAG: aminoglycoside 6-adenylyltransferase [Candidatus Atribacteria bacterium]|nr:aminoglycoside 6-adenylyltransferase [Candidatus Atribacteria bacterium]